jgi:serine/threonine-protein kinase
MASAAESAERLKAALADRYVIKGELGRGGMATVYLAEDLKHRRKVAVKVLNPDLSEALGAERFLREIEVAANLMHPHILPVFDSGEADGLLYSVMPLVQGGSLRDRLEQEGQLPIDEAVKITCEIADALAHAHEREVVHRDVKPANILLSGDHAVLADFGIAQAVAKADETRLTKTGVFVGTPAYMSPEQATGEQGLDGRSDQYALACVLYEMLAGGPPFTGANSQMVLARHLGAAVPSITAARAGVPPPVAAAMTRALGKMPEDRYPSASAFWDALLSEKVEPPKKSIAVLPFANMSPDPENEYFSDGITEEIINALSKLKDLRVAARTSSFALKGQTRDIREVGQKLQVGTVLEGSVRKAGNRLRITAQLINVADGYHLWSERYDREMTDVFAVQDEIAAAVVKRLKVSLLGPPTTGARDRHSKDLEAYELYLRGRHLWNQRGEAMKKGLACFQNALQRDPEYALALAGVADGHALIGLWSGTKGYDLFEQGKAAAKQALELNPSLAEAHASLGFIAMFHDWDWPVAEQELLQALELNPGYVDAHLFYGQYLGWIEGDPEAAVRWLRHGHELDPLSVTLMAQIGIQLANCDRPEDGLAELERALELAPNTANVHVHKAWALRGLSRYAEAIEVMRGAMQLGGTAPAFSGELALSYAGAGLPDEARAILQEEALRVSSPGCAAVVHAALGEGDTAFDCLDEAYDQRDPVMPLIRWYPEMDSVRDDPRFQGLMRRMAFPTNGGGRVGRRNSFTH